MEEKLITKNILHRFTSNEGIELIKKLEGFRPTPYICAGGYLTIGYGHKILPSDRFNEILEEKAENLLKKDLIRVERAIIKYIETILLNSQFDALVSFTFNVGAAALQRSTLRQKINYNLYHQAGMEFLKWVYAGGRKLTGLVHRRKIEMKLFLSELP